MKLFVSIMACACALTVALPAPSRSSAAPAPAATVPAARGIATPIIDTAAAAERFEALAGGPSAAALAPALAAYERAVADGLVANQTLLTVIDYTRRSTEPRLWVLDLAHGRILHHELVAHGRGSGDNVATSFSNIDGSHMSSLGLFVTGEAYQGQNGYSLRLRGLDAGINDNAFARAIVIHGAPYVSPAFAARTGRLGRSWGCPAVRLDVAKPLIDLIKNGTVVYAHGPRASSAAPTSRIAANESSSAW